MKTGEVVQQIREQTFTMDREPEYIKVYINPVLDCFGADLTLAPYLIAFCRHMTFANTVRKELSCTIHTDAMVRRDVADSLQVSERSVYNALKKLVEMGVFLPVVADGKKKRGIYFVNPWIAAKGEWRDIKALRSSFHFSKRMETSVVIDKNGKPEIYFSIPDDDEDDVPEIQEKAQ